MRRGVLSFLSLFVALSAHAAGPANQGCRPLSQDETKKLGQLYDSATPSLRKFQDAQQPIKDTAGCLKTYVKARQAACAPRQEFDNLDRKQRAPGQNVGVQDFAGGCVYIRTMFDWSLQSTKDLIEVRDNHKKNADTLYHCLVENEDKLKGLKISEEEKKTRAAEIPQIPKELQQLAKVRNMLKERDMAEVDKIQLATEQAYSNVERLNDRLKKCPGATDDGAPMLSPKLPRFR